MQVGLNGGNCVPDGGVLFEGARGGDLDGAESGHAAEIVAEEIDDHGELGVVFGRSEQIGGEGLIGGGIGGMARARAFDGTGDHMAVADVQEELRRRGQQMAGDAGPIAELQVGGVGRG